MWRYFELLSFRPMAEIDRLRAEIADGRNPRDVKFELGVELVTRFHSAERAKQAQDSFVARFQKGALPDDIPEVELDCEADDLPIANVLKDAGLTSSTSESMRMIKQGAVRLQGERLADPKQRLEAGGSYLLQVGKRRFAKVFLR